MVYNATNNHGSPGAAAAVQRKKTRGMRKEQAAERHTLEWQGRKIVIDYQPQSFAGCAHLQIRARGCRPLPITETGYRSHFASREDVEQYGGPAGYVQGWLDATGQTKAWRRIATGGLQLSLF